MLTRSSLRNFKKETKDNDGLAMFERSEDCRTPKVHNEIAQL